jgi:hypothetical protein
MLCWIAFWLASVRRLHAMQMNTSHLNGMLRALHAAVDDFLYIHSTYFAIVLKTMPIWLVSLKQR